MIYAENKTLSEQTAAEILDGYLQKIAGYPYKTTGLNSILIKECDLYGDDGYSFRTADGCLTVSGGRRGVIYGVFSLLEEYFGCRFYAPGVEKIPEGQLPDFSLVGNRSVIPPVRYRNVYWYSAFDELFSVKQKINGSPGRMISDKYGNSIRYAGNFVHTLGELAEMQGDVTDRQPCLSDDAVFETVLKNIRARLDADPEALIISVSQNDSHSWSGGSTCSRCAAVDLAEESPMGSLLSFINKIADAVSRSYPDVMIDTLAYRYTRKPPKTLKARDNVIIRLCSIECCFSHPVHLCDAVTDQAAGGSFADILRQWSEICKNIYVWDYTTDFAHYAVTFPNFKVIRENIRYFVENNVTGIFEQGNYSSASGEFGELRSYLLAKCLWDPYMTDIEYDNHTDDFLEGYYGAGWRNIRAYIDLVHEGVKCRHIGIYSTPSEIIAYDSVFREESERLWNAALAKADDDRICDRINKSYIQVCYYQALIRKDPCYNRRFYDRLLKYSVSSLREGSVLKGALEIDFAKDPSEW